MLALRTAQLNIKATMKTQHASTKTSPKGNWIPVSTVLPILYAHSLPVLTTHSTRKTIGKCTSAPAMK